MSDLDTGLWDREYPSEEESAQAESSLYEEEDEIESEYEDDGDDGDDEDLYEFLAEDFEEEESLMNNARIRLEQGRLYEMLLKHNLFDGVDAAPEAIDNVQKEMKEYIMDRLEILLGMKAEKETEVRHIQESQFNDMEIQALKMIASKVTKGASAVASEPEDAPELNTIKQKETKLAGLRPLNNKKPEVRVKKKKTQPKPEPRLKTKGKQRKLKKEMTDVGTKDMSINDIAKRDMKYVESLKNLSLEEASKVVGQRHSRPRPKATIDQSVVNAIYTNRMATNEVANTFTALLAAAKNK